MRLAESEFVSYIQSRCFKGSVFNDGGLTPVVKQISGGGFSVSVHDSMIEITLSSTRKSIRKFGSIDSAALFLNKVGFVFFECQLQRSGI